MRAGILAQAISGERDDVAAIIDDPVMFDALLARAVDRVGARIAAAQQAEAEAAREAKRAATGKMPAAAEEFLTKAQALADAIAEKLAQLEAAQNAAAEALGKLALRRTVKTVKRDANGLIASVEEVEEFDYCWGEPAELGAAVVDVLAAAVVAIGSEGVKTLNARVAEFQRAHGSRT